MQTVPLLPFMAFLLIAILLGGRVQPHLQFARGRSTIPPKQSRGSGHTGPKSLYVEGRCPSHRRIPAPLSLRRHAGLTELDQLCTEILGLSKMNWNTFDLYTKFPATLQSSGQIGRIGSLLRSFGASSYDYRLFI